jgi:cytochrome c553
MTERRLVLVVLTCLSWSVAGMGQGQAQSPDPVGLADACTSCHGLSGHSRGYIPSISGMDQKTLVAMLQGFKAQQGNPTIMNRIARGYSDAEFEALATYFASLPRND